MYVLSTLVPLTRPRGAQRRKAEWFTATQAQRGNEREREEKKRSHKRSRYTDKQMDWNKQSDREMGRDKAGKTWAGEGTKSKRRHTEQWLTRSERHAYTHTHSKQGWKGKKRTTELKKKAKKKRKKPRHSSSHLDTNPSRQQRDGHEERQKDGVSRFISVCPLFNIFWPNVPVKVFTPNICVLTGVSDLPQLQRLIRRNGLRRAAAFKTLLGPQREKTSTFCSFNKWKSSGNRMLEKRRKV